jgi:hypothetical protein
MKHEFESLAIRGTATISQMLYETIERYYMSTNYYHEAHGGADESKHHFVQRVFGGKVNTPKTILEKIIKEAQYENRWCLRDNASATKAELDRMDNMIADQLTWEARQD